jgi:hypothetical protein
MPRDRAPSFSSVRPEISLYKQTFPRARGACGSRPPRHADRPQRPPAPACHGGDRRVPRRDGSLVGLRIGRLDRLSGRRQHPAVPLAIGQIVYVRGLGAHKYRVMAVVGEPCEPRYKLRHMLAILSDTPKDILEVERPEADLTVTRPPSRHHRPGRVRGGSPRRRILDRAPARIGDGTGATPASYPRRCEVAR